jgi:hypothetical protein
MGREERRCDPTALAEKNEGVTPLPLTPLPHGSKV